MPKKIRRYLFWILCSLPWVAAIIGWSVIPAHKRDWYLSHVAYRLDLSWFPSSFHKKVEAHRLAEMEYPNSRIIFMGDSMIKALPVEKVHPESLNFGIVGDTTRGLLQRITHYQSIDYERIFVLCIGINDMGRTATNDPILQQYATILNCFPDNGVVVVCALFSVDETIFSKRSNKRIRAFNQALRSLCEDTPRLHIKFLAQPAELIDKSGQLKAAYHVGDGIHLNEVGNQLWIQALREVMAEIQAEQAVGGDG